MNPVTAFTDSNPSATSTASPATGSLAAIITSGSQTAIIRFTNSSDTPLALYYRTPGQTAYSRLEINPQASMERYLALTAARTVEYYYDAGSISCEVIDFFGTGLTPASVTVTDIRTTLLDSGYSLPDISDATITEYISIINIEVTDAATKHANIAGFALNASIKTNAIKFGSLWMTLTALRNLGASEGRIAQAVIVSSATIDEYKGKYHDMLTKISSGINYGA